MLRSKLDEADISLAIILQDAILFSEFMRNTKDGAMSKDLWPKKPFKYRWYQRDLMTDRSDAVILTGGRAIGKCLAAGDRVYTSEGYKSHKYLQSKRFMVWSLTKEGTLELKRASCLIDGIRRVRVIETESGLKVFASKYHPFLTPKGYVLAEDLQVGDQVAVVTKLPQVLQPLVYRNDELRLLGYMLFQDMSTTFKETKYQFRSTAVRKDIERCCKTLDIKFTYENETDLIHFFQARYSPRHPITHILTYFELHFIKKHGWFHKKTERRLPNTLMTLGEENLKHFLEGILAQYAEISTKEMRLYIPNYQMAEQFKELLLRFGIETIIKLRPDTENKGLRVFRERLWHVDIVTRDQRAIYRLLTTFNLAGYKVGKLQVPPPSLDATEHYRYEAITSIGTDLKQVYAVQVEDTHTYIAEDMHVHNSLVLEDKVMFDVIQHEQQLVETKEFLLTTANQNQLTPILDRLVMRFYTSPILKSFISGGLNRQKGVMDFNVGGADIRMHARVAGLRGENNVVGLHLPRAIIDESQVYPLATYKQLVPAINQWEKNTQIFAAGVPNGVQNTTLYYLDQRNKRFKKYRIPATNNPYFTYQDYIQALKDHGGEDSDLFIQLVLGGHGKGAEVVIGRDDIAIEAFDFYNYSYRSRDKTRGAAYTDKLERPILDGYSMFVAGIDTGFTDPTIIQVFGLKNGKWYLVVRYLLQRIEFSEQEIIINWLHKHFNFEKIMIDIGAGGGGAGILQNLINREEYSGIYRNIIHGVQFSEKIIAGYTEKDENIMQDTKTIGADELVRQVQGKRIILNEFDTEGISQLERIARQKNINGDTKYFVLSDTGKGISGNDHIFASFICFVMAIRDIHFVKTKRKKLGKATV